MIETIFNVKYKLLEVVQFLYKVKRALLPFLTNLRVSKTPFWMMYQPQDYKVKGQDIQKISKVIQPGDIILRGFDKKFLDGLMVPNKFGYTQSGIYIGFNRVIHMTTKGISNSHLYDYCAADKIFIVRPCGDKYKAVRLAKQYLYNEIPYDYFCKQGEKSLYCHQFCVQCYPDLKFKSVNCRLFKIELPSWYGTCYIDDSLIDPKNIQTVWSFG